jgi:PKD repeat protein
MHWDWGDGSGGDSGFPATHTYSKAGTYTITVTAYQSDSLTTTKTVQVKVEAPSISIFVPVDNFICKLGTTFPILLTVEDNQGNLVDATVNCKVLTPKGGEILLYLSRITTGVYATSFTGTTEIGDYRIIITAQKPGYTSDTKELTLHVQGKAEYEITEISRTSARHYFIRGPSEAIIKVDGEVTKEDDHFNIDLSLTNTRDAYYNITIYSMPPLSPSSSPPLKLLYSKIIQPEQVLYPVRIQVPVYSGEVSYIAIHVEVDFTREFLRTLADLIGKEVFGKNHIVNLIGSMSDINCYREEIIALKSKLESYMVKNGYLSRDYSNLDFNEQGLKFVNGFIELTKKEPEYVTDLFLDAATHCLPNIAEAGIATSFILGKKAKTLLLPIVLVADMLLKAYQYSLTPAEEIIYIKISKVSSGNIPSRTSLGVKNFLFAVNSLKPLNGAIDFSLQKYLGSNVLASSSNPQFESNTTGSITINLFKDRLTYNLDMVFPVSEQLALGSTDIFSMASNGVRKGEFIVANATINFVFSDNENASYFFEIVNSSSLIRETVSKLTGFNVVWNVGLHINGSSVYLRATGLKPASPGLTREDWTEVVRAGQVSLHIFREFEVQNVGNNSYITRRLISPEVFSVASAYRNRIIVRLFIAPKIGILAFDPKPTFCEGDPEVGYECSWSQVPEELTLSYIVDEAPPVISKIEQDPKTVTFENDVTITVNVSDIGVGLKNVTVAYSTDNGATWKRLKAEQVAGDIRQGYFKAVIPKQPYGTSVAYKLEIYDRAGNAEQSDTITYQVELAPWVYGLLILVIILVIIIGYKVYHTRHQHFA